MFDITVLNNLWNISIKVVEQIRQEFKVNDKKMLAVVLST